MKLTPEMIEQAMQWRNPVRDWELDLRGYKIPVIENMGATLDQFDSIDLSDNDIRRLDGFPHLNRLKWLLLNNNRIVRLGEDLIENLPRLEALILTNNSIQELGDLDILGSMPTLEYISLLRNPVSAKKYYRLYVIHKCPNLRWLDFKRVRKSEKDRAHKMFKGKKGKALASEIGTKSKTFTPGAGIPQKKAPASVKPDVVAIKRAIANASTLEEVERLNQMLRSGQLPTSTNGASEGGDAEEMDTS